LLESSEEEDSEEKKGNYGQKEEIDLESFSEEQVAKKRKNGKKESNSEEVAKKWKIRKHLSNPVVEFTKKRKQMESEEEGDIIVEKISNDKPPGADNPQKKYKK